jgi:hypothetical protein
MEPIDDWLVIARRSILVLVNEMPLTNTVSTSQRNGKLILDRIVHMVILESTIQYKIRCQQTVVHGS